MRKLFGATVMMMTLLVAANAAYADNLDRKNLQVFNDVSKQVNRYTYFTIFDDVQANVDNGVVTLSGRVTMPFKSKDIEKRVAKIDGVSQVVNRIETLPVSIFDDELRLRIARLIYGNPSFWDVMMVNLPIHIVVERGHVTLTGVVNSEVERMLARSLATTFGTFSVKNELKTDAEAREALESLQ